MARAEGCDAATQVTVDAGIPYRVRSPEQIGRFFDGLELLEPGVVSAPRWRPDTGTMDDYAEIAVHCGVARKP